MINPLYNQSHLLHDVCMSAGKLLNVVLSALPFFVCWHFFFSGQITLPLFYGSTAVVLAVYAFFYAVLANLYGGYAVAFSQISELVYGQSLAAAISDVITYFVLLLLAGKYVDLRFLAAVLIAQVLLSIIWSVITHHIYFALNPPLRSVLLSDNGEAEEISL